MVDEPSASDLMPVFDVLDVGIILVDRGGTIAVWNDWIAHATRLPATAVVGRNLFDVFPGLRQSRLPAAIEESFEVGSSSLLTHSLNSLLPLRGETDEELLHNIIVRPVSTRQASQLCLLQINDVSVFVIRERVLRERQNARYHAIVDTAPDAIITISFDRTIQWVNGAAGRVFGYATAELLGQKIDLLLADDDCAGIFSGGGGGGGGGGAADKGGAHQVYARRRDGISAPFEMSFARWKSDDRTFITTIWRDVTERMAAERAVRDSEGRQRALLEALPQLVWTCGPDGGCDYFNPQWRGYTGASANEHHGRGWLDVIHDAEREDVGSAWKAALASGAVFDAEARLRRADGAHRWFKMRSIPVSGSAGEAPRWFGTATDITDMVEARDALQRSNDELEALVAERTHEREVALAQLYESQKMETIGQLTGGVAHDFNNLLAVILGSLALLKKTLPDDPRVSRLLDGAMQGAERGATLTRRLLAFARRQELKLEAVEIQKLVPDMLDFLRQSVGPGIAIHVDFPPDLQPVKIDANQLELALMNLAINARDAMPNGGAITIACRNATGDAKNLPKTLPAGEYVRVSVADTGEGMNEATRAKAMEPFFTTKGLGKGTGLGLSMVHGLTAQSGGAMEITSRVGKGTTVTLWLPRAGPEDFLPATPVQTAPSEDAATSRLRILLVDDDVLVSMNTADMLTDLGHRVVEAHSALHALELLKSDGQFDVVVTDFDMPVMNGLELAMRVKERAPGLPVILATGYAELPNNAANAFPRLAKPYTQEQLAEALESALSSRSP